MLSKTLGVLDLAEPITDIHYHSGDSIDSDKWPAVLLLASPITIGNKKARFLLKSNHNLRPI